MKRVNLQKVKKDSFAYCSIGLQEQGSTCCGCDSALHEQSGQDASINSSRQFGVEEVNGGDGMTYCVMCYKSFQSVVTFADHLSRVHNKTSITVASQLWLGEQTYINYYDLKPKLEIDEDGVKVERECIFSPEKSNVTCSTHNKDIVIKSEECSIIDCKREEYAVQNVVKKEKQSDAAKTHQADEYGPTTLVQIQTDAASSQKAMKTEKDSNQYNEEKIITLQALINPSLGTRGELTGERKLATVNFIPEINRFSKKYISEGTEKKSLSGYNRDYNHELKSRQRIFTTGEKSFACNMCNYKSRQKSSLEKHISNHTGVRLFACSMCGYKCNRKGTLKLHIRKHTGEKPFACDMCGYKCRWKGSLKTHIRTHTGEKPFACDMCGYKCSWKGSLKTHIRTHTGEKPFACNMCDYKCNRKMNLARHIRTHTGVKPFACKMCDYKCNEESRLKIHIITHTEEKPFACSMCFYKCIARSRLITHIKIHTGEKPFACNMCDYKCNWKMNLARHIRTHTGVKPFACKMCNYKCSEESKLKIHIITHTEEKPFACSICEFKCNRKSSLTRHIRTHTRVKPLA